jgi:hypothetical protein
MNNHPTDEVFKDIKTASIEIWKTYNNQFGYVDEKVDSIKKIENISDNAGFIIAKFDYQNQNKLINYLKLDESKKYVAMLLKQNRSW